MFDCRVQGGKGSPELGDLSSQLLIVPESPEAEEGASAFHVLLWGRVSALIALLLAVSPEAFVMPCQGMGEGMSVCHLPVGHRGGGWAGQ